MGPFGLPRGAERKTVGAATIVACLCVAAGASAGGGIGAGGGPKVKHVRCIETCAGAREATIGSKIELTGTHLRSMRRVSFRADGGGRIEVHALDSSRSAVKARVPAEAITGKPGVEGGGAGDTAPEVLKIVDEDQIPDEGPFQLATAKASPAKAYYQGQREPKLTYSFEGEATDVRILIAKKKTDTVVRTIVQDDRQPGTHYKVRWNGRTKRGKPAGNGKYRFKIGPKPGNSLDSSKQASFGFYDHKFPIRGRHSYGDGIGAGRGHQGQDVFARCGTRLEAARGGRVQWKRFHGSAGYYLVIDGAGTRRDYTYMHMRKRGRPREGSRVKTGERIGYVSDTGNATGCHLHFEIWSKPGWYEGGHFTNPTDDLRRWDRWS